ncbi:hypothetical protein P3W45_001159 [Vairimorpha bombi]|jgi:hypothetical protein
MKEDKTIEDEYSILNIHKNSNETALDWKSFNKNKSSLGNKETNAKIDDTSLDELKKSITIIDDENLKKFKLDNFENENISYKRLKMSRIAEEDSDRAYDKFPKENKKLTPEIDKNNLSKINVYQNCNKDSFHIEAIDISDIQAPPTIVEEPPEKMEIDTKDLNDLPKNLKNNIDPKITNILRERLSNIITPKPTIKQNSTYNKQNSIYNKQNSTYNRQNSIYNRQNSIYDKQNSIYDKQNNLVNNDTLLNTSPHKNSIVERKVNYEEYKNSSCIDQSTLDILKNKLNEEINKTQPQKIQFVPELNNMKTENLITQLKAKIQNESKLRKEIVNLESVIRLQNLEIENLKRRELPKNNSVSLIQEGKSAIQKLRSKFEEMEQNHQSELSKEKSKNYILSKEITNLKLMIDSLLDKLKKNKA